MMKLVLALCVMFSVKVYAEEQRTRTSPRVFEFNHTEVESYVLFARLNGQEAGLSAGGRVNKRIVQAVVGIYHETEEGSGTYRASCKYLVGVSDETERELRMALNIPFVSLGAEQARSVTSGINVSNFDEESIEVEFTAESDRSAAATRSCLASDVVKDMKKDFIEELYSELSVYSCESFRDCGVQHLTESDRDIFTTIEANAPRGQVYKAKHTILCREIFEGASRKACQLRSLSGGECSPQSQNSVEESISKLIRPIALLESGANMYPACDNGLECVSQGVQSVNELQGGILRFFGVRAQQQREVYKCE